MKHIIFPIIMASSLFSCSMSDNANVESAQVADVNKESINRAEMSQGNFRFTAPKREEKPDERSFEGKELANNINFYIFK